MVDHNWPYFEQASRWLRGIERIHLTGGEPTAHPSFGNFVPRFKELFGCQLLTIETNGYRVREHEAVLNYFDRIYATPYPENAAEVAWLSERFDVSLFDGVHVPLAKRGSGLSCARGMSEGVAYSGGRFFPCCVGPGIESAASLMPCEDWRRRIIDIPLPCTECCFSPD